MYMAVKHIHLLCVALSIAFLMVRFFWRVQESPMLQKKWVKISPHIIDTCLLLSALALCVIIAQYPFVHSWLTEKIIAVIAYIICGFMAIKGRLPRIRWMGFLGAIGWLALVVRVAITKQNVFLG